jgi:hypothetical protein
MRERETNAQTSTDFDVDEYVQVSTFSDEHMQQLHIASLNDDATNACPDEINQMDPELTQSENSVDFTLIRPQGNGYRSNSIEPFTDAERISTNDEESDAPVENDVVKTTDNTVITECIVAAQEDQCSAATAHNEMLLTEDNVRGSLTSPVAHHIDESK